MLLPEPVFAGFFPKPTPACPAWLESPAVRSISSVSLCMSGEPKGWLQRWLHNELGFYNTAQTALDVLAADPQAYDLYAYEVFPLRCLDRKLEAQALQAAPGRVPPGYEFLGHDVVSRSAGAFFECSPLSCNGLARQAPVNAHCLVDDQAQALQLLLDISAAGSGAEPGPYYLFRVHRIPKFDVRQASPRHTSNFGSALRLHRNE